MPLSPFLLFQFALRLPMIQCVWGEGALARQHRLRWGGFMIKMVDIVLSAGVGRGQEEKVGVSTPMLFFRRFVHRQTFTESLLVGFFCLFFFFVQVRCHLSLCVKTLQRCSFLKQPSASFHPSGPFFPLLVSCFVFSFLFIYVSSATALLVCQPTPLHIHRCRDPVLPKGINEVHFILPVWVVLMDRATSVSG